ncbi:DUF7094 domain-containing protein [Halorhabdus amylolytica]|uniref:DUF7094 domain-containing protein n=1 Tax=Halorhabdus amylolytica TaxID=2559573 RepID=UPI0010AB4E79|nr:hypothetical protein [Halorhabdus amylolytica]
MQRRAAALIALSVLGSVSVIAVATGTTPAMALIVESQNGTVSQLDIPAENVSADERVLVNADLSSALATDRERLRATVDSGAFGRAFEASPNRTSRIETIQRTLDAIVSESKQLREQRNEAVRAYNRGEYSSEELFRELARISASAGGIRDRVTTIETTVERSEFSMPPDVAARLSSVEAEVVSLDGPLTQRLVRTTRAERPAGRLSLRSSEDGIVMGAVDGETYLREATVWTARAETGENVFGSDGTSPLVSVHERAQSVYPWAFENLVSNPSISGFGDSPVYPVSLNHAHGELETYFDGRTTDVFFEVQRLSLSSLPTTTVATERAEFFSIEVNETTSRGLLSVSVFDADSGDPVSATVSVGNETVGTTGSDGRLWMLPVSDSETITAHNGEGSVSVTVS